MWAGAWRAEWTVALADGKYALSGHMYCRAHYYENGNVQLNNDKAVEAGEAVAYADAEKLAKGVVEALRQHEEGRMAAWAEVYARMSSETFKEMRRIMPKTQPKFAWNAAHTRPQTSLAT